MRNTLTVSTLHINFILNFYINRKRQEDWATTVNHCCWPLGPDKFPSPSRDNTINHPHKLFIWRKLYKIADGAAAGFMDVLLFGGFHLENKSWWLAVGGNVGIPLEAVTITARLTLIIWSRAEQGPTSRHYILHPHTHQHLCLWPVLSPGTEKGQKCCEYCINFFISTNSWLKRLKRWESV